MSLSVDLAPIADVSSAGSVSYVGFSTGYQTLADDSDSTYTQLSSLTSAKQTVRVAPMVTCRAIEQVVLSWRVANAPGTFENEGQETRAGVRIGGVDYASDWEEQTYTIVARSKPWSTDPSTGLPWTRSGLDAAEWFIEQKDDSGDPSDPSSSRFYRLRVTPTYIAASSDLARVRDIASRELERRRKAARVVEISAPTAKGLGLRPLDRVAVEHWASRGPDGQPHGPRDWQRWQGLVRSLKIQPEAAAGEVRLQLEDWRRMALLLYDGGATPLTPGAIANGVPRILRGNALTFSRASVAYAPDPASGLISEAQIDEELLTADAAGPWQIHEGERTNYLLDSSNSRGVAAAAGWSITSVTNGSSLLWDPDLSGQTFLFNASTDQLEQTTGTLPQHVCLSLDHLCSGADPIRWSARRSSDSQWFRASDATWHGSEQINVATASASWRRDHWHLDLGGSTTLFLRLRGPSSGTAEVGHAQTEEGRYPTSRILTEGATVTRAAASREYAWTTATRLLLAAQGGLALAVQTEWDAAEVPSGRRTLLSLVHDADNGLWFGWDATDGLVLEIEVAGTTYTASTPWSPVAGTTYRVGAFWCSSRGELGNTAYTLNVCLDGVLGTADVAAASMTEAASGDLEVGSLAGADHWDGGWRELRTVQYVPTAGELGRGLR